MTLRLNNLIGLGAGAGGVGAAFGTSWSTGPGRWLQMTQTENANTQKAIFSCWFKNTESAQRYIWRTQGGNADGLQVEPTQIRHVRNGSSRASWALSGDSRLLSDRFRHIWVKIDTSAPTQPERVQCYVDGQLIATGNDDNGGNWNRLWQSGNLISCGSDTATPCEGAMGPFYLLSSAQPNFDDLTPGDFGYDDNGTWRYKAYDGPLASPGFAFLFEDDANPGKNAAPYGDMARNVAVPAGWTDIAIDNPANNFCSFDEGTGHSDAALLLNAESVQRTRRFTVKGGRWAYELRGDLAQVNNVAGIQSIEGGTGSREFDNDAPALGVRRVYLLDLVNGTWSKQDDGGAIVEIASGLNIAQNWHLYHRATFAGYFDFGQRGFNPPSGYKAITRANGALDL